MIDMYIRIVSHEYEMMLLEDLSNPEGDAEMYEMRFDIPPGQYRIVFSAALRHWEDETDAEWDTGMKTSGVLDDIVIHQKSCHDAGKK